MHTAKFRSPLDTQGQAFTSTSDKTTRFSRFDKMQYAFSNWIDFFLILKINVKRNV